MSHGGVPVESSVEEDLSVVLEEEVAQDAGLVVPQLGSEDVHQYVAPLVLPTLRQGVLQKRGNKRQEGRLPLEFLFFHIPWDLDKREVR